MNERRTDSGFADARAKILDIGNHFRKMLPADEVEPVDRILEDLKQSRFEVAIIGQIKAGKSTFLNALMERPDFLPTDVNPWTAVITRLHFGNPGVKADRGEFHFYTEEEWSQLPKKRKVSWELERLLGQSHPIEHIEPADLETYLAVGRDPDKPHAGKYSAITREADLFLAHNPFAEACTIVDTLGTNDVDPVREKITLDYLGQAHAYVMVLDASRPVDRTGLEFLQHVVFTLRKERLLLFANRIETLSLEDQRKNIGEISRMIEKEFPGMQMDILTGCAYWGQLASVNDARRLEKQFRVRRFAGLFKKFGIERGYFDEQEFDAWSKALEQHADAIREALLRASGMREARAAIANVLLREKGLFLLNEARGQLQRQADKAVQELKTKIEDQEGIAATLEKDKSSLEQEIARLENKIVGLRNGKKSVKKILATAKEQLNELHSASHDELRRQLNGVAVEFVNRKTKELIDRGISFWDARLWTVSLSECRSDLQKKFEGSFGRDRQTVKLTQDEFQRKLQEALARLDPRTTYELDAVTPTEVDASPSMAALGRTTEIDLGDWLSRLFSGTGTTNEKANDLQRKVKSELDRVVDDLVTSASKAIRNAIRSTLMRFDYSVDRGIDRATTELNEIQITLAANRDAPDKKAAQIRIAQEQAQRLRDQADRFQSAASEIRNISLPKSR